MPSVVTDKFRQLCYSLPSVERIEYLLYVIENLTEMESVDTEALTKIKLNPSHILLLTVLNRYSPRTVPLRELMNIADFCGRDTVSTQESLKAMVCQMRRRLRDAGSDIEIETIWGVGYRLPRKISDIVKKDDVQESCLAR